MPRKKSITKTQKVALSIVFVFALLAVVLYMMMLNGDIILLQFAGKIFANTWWIILPIPVWKIFKAAWDEYIEIMWSNEQQRVHLEIHPPSDVEKSPKIMEQIFNGLYTFSTPNKFDVYCGWRPLQDKFSFEIVSTEGSVHFYAMCPKMARNNVEAQIYAQYPDAEIFEVEDYTNKVPMNIPNKEWDLWGSTMKLMRKDAIPIRTYVEFQEDVTGKMIDPVASLAEVFGSLGKGQHAWLQVVFSPVAESEWYPDSLSYIDELTGKKKESAKSWSKNPLFNFFQEFGVLFGNFFRGILGGELLAPEGATSDEKSEPFNINNLTPGEQETLKAVHHNISKTAFRTSIRFVYLGKRETFNKALGVAGSMGALKQLSDVNLNSLVTDADSKTFANYYYTEPRLTYRQRRILQDYRSRSMSMQTFYFNVEELATVFHFPDMSVMTPSIHRVEAKKGEAPANLPVEFEASF